MNSLRRAAISKRPLRFSIQSETAISPFASGKTQALLRRPISLRCFGCSGRSNWLHQRMTETTARAVKSGHAATSAYGFLMATRFELIRRNPDRAATFARSLIKIANEHQLPFWMAISAWFDGWLEWRSGDRKPGLAAMRNSLARQAEQGSVTTFFETLLAEAEAEAGQSDVAFLHDQSRTRRVRANRAASLRRRNPSHPRRDSS